MNAEFEENAMNGVCVDHVKFVRVTIGCRRTGEAWRSQIQAHIPITERCCKEICKGNSDAATEEIFSVIIGIYRRFTSTAFKGVIKYNTAFDKEIRSKIILGRSYDSGG